MGSGHTYRRQNPARLDIDAYNTVIGVGLLIKTQNRHQRKWQLREILTLKGLVAVKNIACDLSQWLKWGN
jgi:hypothetical protein